MDPACGLCEYDITNPASTSNVKNFDQVMHIGDKVHVLRDEA